MQSRRIVTVLLVALAGPAATGSDEAVLTFPVSQCRYTLPGKDWTWADSKAVPQAICAARHPDGLGVMVTVNHVPAGTAIDTQFPDGFDEGVTASGPLRKRGGRLTTFKGLPCYESEWLVRDQLTAVIRVMIANGFAYQVQLLGGTDPVEKRPDFEAIMSGFDFTAPPVPPSAADPLGPGKRVARMIGRVFVYVMAGFAVWGFVTVIRRRQ